MNIRHHSVLYPQAAYLDTRMTRIFNSCMPDIPTSVPSTQQHGKAATLGLHSKLRLRACVCQSSQFDNNNTVKPSIPTGLDLLIRRFRRFPPSSSFPLQRVPSDINKIAAGKSKSLLPHHLLIFKSTS